MIIAIYFFIACFSVFGCDALLFALQENQMPIFKYWNKQLMKLRERDSVWAKPLGMCNFCFTNLVVSIILLIYTIYSYQNIYTLLLSPFIIFINFGVINFFIIIKNILKK